MTNAGRALPVCLVLLLAACGSNKAAPASTTSRPAILPPTVVSAAASASPVAVAARAENQGFPAAGQPVDGIPCETTEKLTYHVHAHLMIVAEGRPVVVPASIGIPGSCIYWLHTHDATGVIHIEAPAKRDFTLGTFFDIWRQPLSGTQALGFTADATRSFQYFVNGQQYTGDPRQIPLGAHTDITIEYGPPFPTPLPYTFPQGL